MAPDPLQQALARITALAAPLPETQVSTSYGTPALRVRDKAFCSLKDAATLYLACPFDRKEMLLETAPEIYYQTDHYKGWPGLLIRLDVIADEELAHRLAEAWRLKAPKRLLPRS